jgi:cobaltochelatase CobN
MHMLRVETRSIDGTAEAVDLDQTPADIVALSFTDTDLSVLAAAWEANRETLPSLRLANLASLRHPFSIDLYLEKVISKAKFVLVRLLGGKDYWRYGVDELARLSREHGIHLAIVAGDHREDARLDEASTMPVAELRRIGAYFSAGGPENIAACLRFAAGFSSGQQTAPEPVAVPAFGIFHIASPLEGEVGDAKHRRERGIAAFSAPPGERRQYPSPGPLVRPPPQGGRRYVQAASRALIVFYRAWMLAADTAPVTALADALVGRGFAVTAVYVTSLKDESVIARLGDLISAEQPGVILNLTAFSASLDGGGSVLDSAGVPVFQLVLSGGGRAQWADSQRGLGPADLAMNVVLPELDGRILAGAISFKGETERSEALEFTRLAHDPDPAGVAHAADLAAGWIRLQRTSRAKRRLACVLSDYPAKGGRTGYAVGLDTPRSVIAIARRLAREGYDIGPPDDEMALIAALSNGETTAILTVADYERLLMDLPASLTRDIYAAWGPPRNDAAVRDGVFHIRIVRAGNLLVAVQPDRGSAASRKTDYHSPLLPPCHLYVAFYLWLRHIERVHAVIQCGTHGTLEWLPGKAVALSDACVPRALLGPAPLIYPFIVNNPGEAAQAKRRTSAVTIGHLTPPLVAAGVHGAAAELEGLFDEYAEAQALDPRRASRLADVIMARAADTGLAAESGVVPGADLADALMKLDAWLCDLKDMRVGDGLHVFGQSPEPARRTETAFSLAALSGADLSTVEALLDGCGDAEMRGLLAALDGKFVTPGPAGAPARGRTDVLPTGRNLYGIDPRAIPTRTAWEIGRRTAEELLTRHVQDHGEWPRSIVLDIWGSASMRTGGDDLAQAFALMGVRPRWDAGSNRVSGFDIMPLAAIGRPRVDVTLRISGLFRDVFPGQITLFDAAVRAVAEQEEAPEDNPLGASIQAGDAGLRIFGAAPGQYGVGVSRLLNSGDWQEQRTLGEAYLDATSHAYGADAEGVPAAPDFRVRVAGADAFVHVQDLADQDVLGADAFAEHEGGFAAAAVSLGNSPALYHADTTTPDRSKIRTLREEVARTLRARATNPRWIAGQMRHGFRGAAEIAESVDNFFAYAALTDVTESGQFDLLFDATLGDERVRTFLLDANHAAARGMADKFDQAIRRGFWTTRRNSTTAVLAALREAAE